MKRLCALLCALALALCLCGCGEQKPAEADRFTVKIVCDFDEEIYQVFYSCYFNAQYYAMGGMADYDHRPLTPETDLTLSFDAAYADGNDYAAFSMDFSPYGKDDTSEAGTTDRVEIAAVYGETYTILLSGDRVNGYTAALQR